MKHFAIPVEFVLTRFDCTNKYDIELIYSGVFGFRYTISIMMPIQFLTNSPSEYDSPFFTIIFTTK